MSLVPATCPKCGGIFEVNDQEEAAICKHCGAPCIVEKAIAFYNNAKANLNAQHHQSDDEKAQALLDNVKAHLARGNIHFATEAKTELVQNYPTDYRADEATVLCDLQNGVEGLVSNNDFRYPISVNYFIKDVLSLHASNPTVCKQYIERIEKEINAYLSSTLKINISGGLAFYKLHLTYLNVFLQKFESTLTKIMSDYKNHIELISQLHFTNFGVNGDGLLSGLAPHVCNAYDKLNELCGFMETGRLKDFPALSIEGLAINGYDDEFCTYIADQVEKFDNKISSAMREYNKTISSLPKSNKLSLDISIFSRIKTATLNLLSPARKAKNEEMKRFAREQQQRREQERQLAEKAELDKRIDALYTEYRALLGSGKIKEAYDLMQNATYYKDRDKELQKFKKGLFGYKYLGYINK